MMILETLAIIAVILICFYILIQQTRQYKTLFSRYIDDPSISDADEDHIGGGGGGNGAKRKKKRLSLSAARKTIPKSM
nr:hypothetical protein [Apis mellifera nudivirus]